MECLKSDWKLFRSKIAEWQEAYMDRLNKEYIELLNSDGYPSEKFWKLDERIRKDRKHPGVVIRLSKQNMIFDIVALINTGVIEASDLKEFSDDLREKVNFLCRNL